MIITSMLDNDLYTFTQMQAIFHQFPGTIVTYKYVCRNPTIEYKENINYIKEKVEQEVLSLSHLKFEPYEIDYLRTISFLKDDFVDFLELFRFNPRRYISIYLNKNKDDFEIRITGPWLQVIAFEVPILAIISEIYSQVILGELSKTDTELILNFANSKLQQKIELAKENNLKYVDYGTRRRFSHDIHSFTLDKLKGSESGLVGTSNVYFARTKGLKPFGTMSHAWIMAHQQLGSRLIDHQKAAFENWAKEYRGDLGIALTDTIGVDAFCRDFDLYFSKLFDGVRHDSGCPFKFVDKITNLYISKKINPRTKTIIFSDGLNFQKMVDLKKYAENMINIGFGIGTNLTNDCGLKPLNIVIKMIRCNHRPVAKISDSPGKGLCEDQGYVDYLKGIF